MSFDHFWLKVVLKSGLIAAVSDKGGFAAEDTGRGECSTNGSSWGELPVCTCSIEWPGWGVLVVVVPGIEGSGWGVLVLVVPGIEGSWVGCTGTSGTRH